MAKRTSNKPVVTVDPVQAQKDALIAQLPERLQSMPSVRLWTVAQLKASVETIQVSAKQREQAQAQSESPAESDGKAAIVLAQVIQWHTDYTRPLLFQNGELPTEFNALIRDTDKTTWHGDVVQMGIFIPKTNGVDSSEPAWGSYTTGKGKRETILIALQGDFVVLVKRDSSNGGYYAVDASKASADSIIAYVLANHDAIKARYLEGMDNPKAILEPAKALTPAEQRQKLMKETLALKRALVAANPIA